MQLFNRPGTTLAAALALVVLGMAAGAPVAAAPSAPRAMAELPSTELPLVLAADGCGPGFFRTLAGRCFPNRRFVGPYGGIHAPPPCPPGYLRAPDRPLCYPVGR